MNNTPIFRDRLKQLVGSGVVLIALLCITFGVMRAISLLGSNPQNPLLPASFVLMFLCPFVLLAKPGRRRMRLTQPEKRIWLLWGFLLGGIAAVICFVLGYVLFGTTDDNWFVTVGNFYSVTEQMRELPVSALFLIFTIPALIFSPLGEEFFFRGLMQTTLERRLNPKKAMLIVAAVFAGIHLFHHGIARQNGEFQVYFISGALWFGLIFATSILFEICCRRARSVWAAVICHASFNLFMNILIFAFLFKVQP